MKRAALSLLSIVGTLSLWSSTALAAGGNGSTIGVGQSYTNQATIYHPATTQQVQQWVPPSTATRQVWIPPVTQQRTYWVTPPPQQVAHWNSAYTTSQYVPAQYGTRQVWQTYQVRQSYSYWVSARYGYYQKPVSYWVPATYGSRWEPYYYPVTHRYWVSGYTTPGQCHLVYRTGSIAWWKGTYQVCTKPTYHSGHWASDSTWQRGMHQVSYQISPGHYARQMTTISYLISPGYYATGYRYVTQGHYVSQTYLISSAHYNTINHPGYYTYTTYQPPSYQVSYTVTISQGHYATQWYSVPGYYQTVNQTIPAYYSTVNYQTNAGTGGGVNGVTTNGNGQSTLGQGAVIQQPQQNQHGNGNGWWNGHP